jgi:hypothetical protein
MQRDGEIFFVKGLIMRGYAREATQKYKRGNDGGSLQKMKRPTTSISS